MSASCVMIKSIVGLFGKEKKESSTIEGEVELTRTNHLPASKIPKELPVIALKNTVIYPHTIVPVFFEDKASLLALDAGQKMGRMIVAVTLNEKARKRLKQESEKQKALGQTGKKKAKSAVTSQLTPDDLYSVGTVSVIQRIMPVAGQKGTMGILQGVVKVKVLEMSRERPFMTAIVDPIEEITIETKETKALMKNALATAQRIIQNTPYLPQELQMALEDLGDPLKFVYLLSTLIRFDLSEKQMILEEDLLENKLKKTAAIFARELEQIELGGKIVSNVKKEFGRMSREVFLRQQLKEIKRELGEETESQREASEYRKKLKKGKLPEEVVKEVNREIERLGDMHPHSSEYQVVRTYLDWIFDLPWSMTKKAKKPTSLSSVEKILEEDHYGLKEIKRRILEYLVVRELNKEHKGPILCFVGPPGVGKTSLGKSIARALNKKFVRVSLGGLRDEAEIRGHRRTYIGAMPGRIIQGIRRAGTIDPVFMLDEIDKVGTDFRGDPSAALLEVLDPEQNDSFHDNYLDVDYDLSKVLFIATANILDTVQPALKDRMEVINISGYIEEEKEQITKQFLWPRVLRRHGLKKKQVKIEDELFNLIIKEYTKEAGVRNLEKELAKLARKCAYLLVEDKQKSITINEKKVRRFLGLQKIYPELARRTAQPGVATGLAVTQAGGEILFVEATKMIGGKNFTLTGSLGDVMKESARTALSLVRARSKRLKIDGHFFKKHDLHLHVPAGAVPKDGPSAGIAMVVALISLLSGKKVRSDMAMTGEITLSGLVLPVGGVKEKVLAAKRAGIKTVILPTRNENDIKEIEQDMLKDIEFKFVDNIDQAIDIVIKK